MNLKSFKNNFDESLRTTDGVADAFKKLWWLYDISKKLGATKTTTTTIRLKYAPPVGKITLAVRNNNGSDSFVISEVFKEQCYALSVKEEVKYVLDLGANAGFTAVFLSRAFPEAAIACVEPMPENITVLKKNLSLNNVNATVVPMAVSTKDGVIEMEVSDKDYGHKVHNIAFGKRIGDETIAVRAASVNTILKELNWPRVDLMKIDIEGYEGVLLNENNGWLRWVQTIIIELHEGVSPEEIGNILKSYAFNHTAQKQGNWIFSKNEIE